MSAAPARARVVTAATVLSMQRGGLWMAGPAIGALAQALEGLPALSADDPLRPIVPLCRDLIDARLAESDRRYGGVRDALAAQVRLYWEMRLVEAAA